jgi:hypothetical protein
MKKVLIATSIVAFLVPVLHIFGGGIYWNIKDETALFTDISFVLQTVQAYGVTLDILFPVSLVALIAGIILRNNHAYIGIILLLIPIFSTIALYTHGIYIGP